MFDHLLTRNGSVRHPRLSPAGLLALFVGVFPAWPIPAIAAGAESGAGDTADPIREIVVVGHYLFLKPDTSGLTGLPVPIEAVPQSISLVDSDFIRAADLKTLADVANFTPGVVNAGNHDGFEPILQMRGFPAAYAVDGINYNVVAGSNYEPDFAVMDRLEVIRGPTSVVFGESSAGGLVNFVTKGATSTTPSYVSVEAGSWNSWRVEGQVAGPLDEAGRVRAIGIAVRDQGDSFINEVDHGKTVLYGGIDAQLGPVTAFIHGGFERFFRTAFDGILTEADGSRAPLPRSFFIGLPSKKIRSDIYNAEADVTWHATDVLDLDLKANLVNGWAAGLAAWACCLDSQGNVGLSFDDYLRLKGWDHGVGLAGNYRLDHWGLQNSFVSLAALYQYDRFYGRFGHPTFNGQPYGGANIFDGEQAISAAFNSASFDGPSDFVDQTVAATTVSAQSMVEVIGHWTVLLAAAATHPTIKNIFGGVRGNDRVGSDPSYRTGLIYEFAPHGNVYLSFSQSFNPQFQYDVDNHLLPPLRAKQYEVGLKFRPGDAGLLLSAAAFHIEQRDQAQYDKDVDSQPRYKPIGQLTHRGIEAAALGHITQQWQINAGVTLLHTKIDIDVEPNIIGRPQLYLPTKTASVFTTYAFVHRPLDGLSIGAGLRYVGPELTAYDGSTRDIPGYALVDAAVTYVRGQWTLQLNAHNLLDRYYAVNTYGSPLYGNDVGDPANVNCSIRRQF